ncbi:DUF3379 family protein [Algibacillus agarilyticus]|uniref:DUF3379 family protein n=1 Tax=Algibacillus agarilyticus TaxID=2234133 RepID=UPI000DD08B4E|nr:DUF3379 family protein [Algibacillus agarilyticus]
MDDLEFRRQIIADPQSANDALQQAADQDPAKQQLLDEMLGLDNKIHQALNIDVPEGLAQRLILKQSIESYKQQEQKKHRWSLGIAASIAFTAALGLSAWIYQPINTSFAGQYALDHLHHELSYSGVIDEQVTLNQVNSKLASFGGKLKQQFTHVSYANFCELNGLKSLHMVLTGQHGQVTVFVLPKDNTLTEWRDFSDERFHGITQRLSQADLIVIGEKNENLEQIKTKLSDNISWSI